MNKIYAKVGQTAQQIGGSCPEDWIEMLSERPSPSHVATVSGEWEPFTELHTRCSPAQGLVALFILKNITESDIAAAIEGVANPLDRYICQIGYTRATEWERESDSFKRIAELLNLTEQDINNLFDIAVTVKV